MPCQAGTYEQAAKPLLTGFDVHAAVLCRAALGVLLYRAAMPYLTALHLVPVLLALLQDPQHERVNLVGQLSLRHRQCQRG